MLKMSARWLVFGKVAVVLVVSFRDNGSGGENFFVFCRLNCKDLNHRSGGGVAVPTNKPWAL